MMAFRTFADRHYDKCFICMTNKETLEKWYKNNLKQSSSTHTHTHAWEEHRAFDSISAEMSKRFTWTSSSRSSGSTVCRSSRESWGWWGIVTSDQSLLSSAEVSSWWPDRQRCCSTAGETCVTHSVSERTVLSTGAATRYMIIHWITHVICGLLLDCCWPFS